MNQEDRETGQSNHLWGKLVANALFQFGIRKVFFSPGSRSTPLLIGFEEHAQIDCVPVLDERSAGFIALGYSKRINKPTALLCTSGSAPTNWFPAVVEASHASVPLFLLSADRPPELQGCASGQTINQENLFGDFVRSFNQAPLPSHDLDSITKLKMILSSAFEKSMGLNSGPVHLNFPFREPLFLQNCDTDPVIAEFPEPKLYQDPPFASDELIALSSLTKKSKRPILIAGETVPFEPLLCLSQRYPIPILCDAVSDSRNQIKVNAILRYENILRNQPTSEQLKPDMVICLGQLPTSKSLRNWLDKIDVKRVVVEPRGINVDPLQKKGIPFNIDFDSIGKLKFAEVEDSWLMQWQSIEQSVELKMEQYFSNDKSLSEPKLVRILSSHLPNDALLHVANSMPIRDCEWFWKRTSSDCKLFSNRGVNGIDGTLGTAIGIAHESGKPTFLLTGELAFLHDSNALLLSNYFIGSLTILLINNQGGGIFEHLPISKYHSFEKCFLTPQSCNFESLASAHGISYFPATSWNDIIKEIEHPIASGIRIIEIQTDRKENRDLRNHLLSLT